VSGYRFLSAAVGPNLAAQLPGTLTAEGQSPHPSVGGTIRDLALLSPYMRGDRAIFRTVKALAQSKPLGEVAQAAKVRRSWLGVADRAYVRAMQPRVDKQGKPQLLAGSNYTPMTSGTAAMFANLAGAKYSSKGMAGLFAGPSAPRPPSRKPSSLGQQPAPLGQLLGRSARG
jgi:hypothetical protein